MYKEEKMVRAVVFNLCLATSILFMCIENIFVNQGYLLTYNYTFKELSNHVLMI